MATYGRSKIAWIVGRNMTAFGSKRLLLNPAISEQAPHLLNKSLFSTAAADLGLKQHPLWHPNYGKAYHFRSQQWKLGSVTINANGLLDNLVVGRRYYNADRFAQLSEITSANMVKVAVETTAKSLLFTVILCILASVVVGLMAVALYVGKVETVPYSKRTRFILKSKKMERLESEMTWEAFKENNKDKILPETHPMSVRVKLITNQLLEALERDLRDDKVWGASPVYALSKWKLALMAYWKGQSFNELRATQYMDHIDHWEAVVVDDSKIGAYCGIAGKIFVNTGLIQVMESDAQLASVIAHEIGHGLCRHFVERRLRFLVPRLYLYFDVAALKERGETNPFLLSKERKNEIEADYIGMLLMASVGYHPSIALEALEKTMKVAGDYYMPDDDSRFTHPSGKKRVALRAQTEEEAMAFYREAPSKVEEVREVGEA